MTTIKTFFEYLPEKKNDPEFLTKLNQIVGTEINRVDQLVHQLLEFAKPSPAVFVKVDIHRLINETLDLLTPQLTKHKIVIIKEFSADGNTVVQADANKLKQALLNIFLNAIDAMPQGGQLEISTTTEKGALIITIKDTGCGISPEDLPHIFEPFYSKKDKGTGLGLAITQSIIEEHRGTITAKSKAGEGTKFILQLPEKNDRGHIPF